MAKFSVLRVIQSFSSETFRNRESCKKPVEQHLLHRKGPTTLIVEARYVRHINAYKSRNFSFSAEFDFHSTFGFDHIFRTILCYGKFSRSVLILIKNDTYVR